MYFQGRRSWTEAGPFTRVLWLGSFSNRFYVACIIKHKDLLLWPHSLFILLYQVDLRACPEAVVRMAGTAQGYCCMPLRAHPVLHGRLAALG